MNDKENETSMYLSLLNELREQTGDGAIAITLLQEIAKDRRVNLMRSAGLELINQPTSKQLNYLKQLGVKVPQGITKVEAGKLIDEAVKKQLS